MMTATIHTQLMMSQVQLRSSMIRAQHALSIAHEYEDIISSYYLPEENQHEPVWGQRTYIEVPFPVRLHTRVELAYLARVEDLASDLPF